MDFVVLLIIAGATAVVLVAGALVFRAGVREGMKMFRIAWNRENGIDPLDEPTKPGPFDPDEPPEETV